MSKTLGATQRKRFQSTHRTLYQSQADFNIADVRAALFLPPALRYTSMPPIAKPKIDFKIQDPKELENQLNNEIHEDQGVLTFAKRLKKSEAVNNSKIVKLMKNEQDALEQLTQWEIDKLGDAKEGQEYGAKIRAQFEKDVETQAEEMLKEDWAAKNFIIKAPAQMLLIMQRQDAQKSGFATTRNEAPKVDVRNLHAIHAITQQIGYI